MGKGSTCSLVVMLGALATSGCQLDDRALNIQAAMDSAGGTGGQTLKRDAARPQVTSGEDAGSSEPNTPMPGTVPVISPGIGLDAGSSLASDALVAAPDGSTPPVSMPPGADAAPPFVVPDAAPVTPPQMGEVLVRDTFEDRSRFSDLSTLISWGERPTGTTAFNLLSHQSRRAIALDREVPRYSGLDDEDSLRTFSAIDYRFPKIVNRRTSRLRVEFDATWDAISSSGEGGRITVALLHDYPSTGPRASDITKRSGAPFARPAYTLRLLNGPRGGGTGQPFLQYGGGSDVRGMFDFIDGGWTPGFLSAPGGGQPGAGDPWPRGGWTEAVKGVGATTWRRFALVVDTQRVWLEADGEVVLELPTPDSASAPNYQYFERFEAVRFAWRGVEQAYLANVTVTVQDR